MGTAGPGRGECGSAAVGALIGCTGSSDGTDGLDTADPEALSVLLVVDNAEPMHDAIVDLAVSLDGIDALLPADARVGVITTDVRNPDHRGALRGPGIIEGPGRVSQLQNAQSSSAST